MCDVGLDVIITNEVKNDPRRSWFETMKDTAATHITRKDYRIRWEKKAEIFNWDWVSDVYIS